MSLSVKQIEWLTWLFFGAYWYGDEGAQRTHDALIKRKMAYIRIEKGRKVIRITPAGRAAIKDTL
jgi:hypothetical protein